MSSANDASRRLLLVHAHPDDESIGTGATMAKYVADGAQVTLVTCTLGEEGEVLVPELAHLAADQEDKLAEYRINELNDAMAILGVTDFFRLGGDGRFRDSGMAWDEQHRAVARDATRDGAFSTTDLLVPTDELVRVIRDRRPQVLITYDQNGGYGHPDHVQAHRITMYGYLLAGIESYRPDLGAPWSVSRVLWTAMSESRMREGIRALRAAGDTETWAGADPDGDMPPMAVSDDQIDAVIDGSDVAERKMASLRAYPTQISFDGPFFKMSETIGPAAWSHEFYRLAAGQPFPTGDGWADDLFAGIETRG